MQKKLNSHLEWAVLTGTDWGHTGPWKRGTRRGQNKWQVSVREEQ